MSKPSTHKSGKHSNRTSSNQKKDPPARLPKSEPPSWKDSRIAPLTALSFTSDVPDLSHISDPSLIVIFKNLFKKDSTTKAKALEDLQSYFSSQEIKQHGIQNSALEAWITAYPRASIDNSRRVRQLSHTLQGQISVVSGKRIAKHMPTIAGVWLAGIYDNDRLVSKFALESLDQVFSTPEKIKGVWKAYQTPILEYSRDILIKETLWTLSDQLTTSSDDAASKYSRVMASSISVISGLLSELDNGEIEKQRDIFEEVLNEEKLWETSLQQDVYVRRSLYGLISACLLNSQTLASAILPVVIPSFLRSSLTVDQLGSSVPLTDTLSTLTVKFPNVWNEVSKGDESPFNQFCLFISKGSQGGSPQFWENIGIILQSMPTNIVPKSISKILKLLEFIFDGISLRDEPKSNLSKAWNTYFIICFRLLRGVSDEIDQKQLLQDKVFPIFEQFVKPATENSRWSLGPDGLSICAATFRTIYQLQGKHILEELEIECSVLTDVIVEDIKLSTPEQPKDYEKSQASLAMESENFFSLLAAVTKFIPSNSEIDIVLFESLFSILEAAINTLRSNNGKPYGVICSFYANDFPQLLTSPSSTYLFSGLGSLSHTPEAEVMFRQSWDASIESLLSLTESPQKFKAISILFSSIALIRPSLVSPNFKLEQYVVDSVRLALNGDISKWQLVDEALSREGTIISLAKINEIFSIIVLGLSGDKAKYALTGIDLLAKNHADYIKRFVSSDKDGALLISKVMLLTEAANDDVASKAETINNLIKSMVSLDIEGNTATKSLISIIRNGIIEANSTSISISLLLDQANHIYEQASLENRPELAAQLIPTALEWSKFLQPFCLIPPKQSLAITNSLGGAVFLVNQNLAKVVEPTMPRDLEGYSVIIRLSSFALKIFKSTDIFSLLNHETQVAILKSLVLVMQLSNDNLGLAGSNNLWTNYTPDVDDKILELISEIQEFLTVILRSAHQWQDNENPTTLDLLNSTLTQLRAQSSGNSPLSFYYSRALSTLLTELIELHGWKEKKSNLDSTIRAMRRNEENIISSASTLIGYSTALIDNEALNRLRQELISDLTGIVAITDPIKFLRLLVLLNSTLRISNHESGAYNIPTQRLIFLVKNLLSWPKADRFSGSGPLLSEIAKVLKDVLPLVKDIYGSHWDGALEFLGKVMRMEAPTSDLKLEAELPSAHAALKLYITLKSIADCNEDMEEAWIAHEKSLFDGLLNLLQKAQKISDYVRDDLHQPLRVTNELLARQITSIPFKFIPELADLYSILAMDCPPIQQSAFDILHRCIPPIQEKISLDVALSKEHAHLPDELLSLILKAPSIEEIANSSFERFTPSLLRSYLFSWLLVFRHFTNSSHTVKVDYIENLKEGGYLTSLLDFSFEFLGHSIGKPEDVSRYKIDSYIVNTEESPRKDTIWLISHLYFLSLKHIPNLTKSWWINCKARQVVLTVEAWTIKFISPLVVSDELDELTEWAAKPPEDDETQLKVKVGKISREIAVAYEIDEQFMQILVRLPEEYPLRPATVEGINRVAVDEKRWRSWLINTQGVINFSVSPVYLF
ncbi:MAG: hypothetical protein M1829_005444 [Trizodia sp. TS-e1964]|nr:MAG: hypothetical protein M1829_005444 [Trizodia sp. TS-e1964]